MTMKEIVFDIEEDEEDGGFIAEAKLSSREQIVTQGDTIEELKKSIVDALNCHFDNALDMPRRVVLRFIKQEILAF